MSKLYEKGSEVKVTEVETFVVANPPPRHGGRYFIFVKLTTDSGISGIGEAYSATFNPHLIAKMIEDTADRFLIGENPFHVETFPPAALIMGINGCMSQILLPH